MAECVPAPVSRVAKKRSFDAKFKITVVEYATKSTNRAAAATFFVDEKSVRQWRKQEASLLALPDNNKRIAGGGRKAKQPELEEIVAAWIFDLRSRNLRVTRTQIQRKALNFHKVNCMLSYMWVLRDQSHYSIMQYYFVYRRRL